MTFCESLARLVLIHLQYILLIIIPPFCNNTRSLEYFLFIHDAFLWQAAFCPFSAKQRAAFQFTLFQ
jgi:hypothetical protein